MLHRLIHKTFVVTLLVVFSQAVLAQNATLKGSVKTTKGEALSYAAISLKGTNLGCIANEKGVFVLENIPTKSYQLMASFVGYETYQQAISLKAGEIQNIAIVLKESLNTMDEVVVTGTLKEVSRKDSPVPVEVYNPSFFKKNPTPNIYEALQNVNGVRPQINCNVCNTGDIHINGLEGPYTMVLIDGMPIVSSLATVYGLSGIPNSLVERMEVVKGPASSLYGSEAIGGLINIITKNPIEAPIVSVDLMATSWLEYTTDVGLRFNVGDKASVLTGVNYFNYDNVVDNNDDNFTDVTLQERISVFQKWSFQRKDNRLFSLAGRYYWEDRWGG